MTDLILHLGAHKTGTSLIQKYFLHHRPSFRSAGLALVDRGESNDLIGWGSRAVRMPQLLRGRVEKDLASSATTVLVSHENSLGRPFVEGRAGLYPHAPTDAEAIARACAGFSTIVVYYVRPIPDYVESYYLQTLHEGAWHGFEEWFERIDDSALRWNPVIDALDRAFGSENVLVADFTEIARGQEEFLRRFMLRASIPLRRVIDEQAVRNASLSARGVEIALAINPFLRDGPERKATRRFLQRHFSNVTEPRARPMPDHIRDALWDRTMDEYIALATRSLDQLEHALDELEQTFEDHRSTVLGRSAARIMHSAG